MQQDTAGAEAKLVECKKRLAEARKKEILLYLAKNLSSGVRDIVGRLNSMDRDKKIFDILFLIMRLSIALAVLLIAAAQAVVSSSEPS